MWSPHATGMSGAQSPQKTCSIARLHVVGWSACLHLLPGQEEICVHVPYSRQPSLIHKLISSTHISPSGRDTRPHKQWVQPCPQRAARHCLHQRASHDLTSSRCWEPGQTGLSVTLWLGSPPQAASPAVVLPRAARASPATLLLASDTRSLPLLRGERSSMGCPPQSPTAPLRFPTLPGLQSGGQ